MANVSAFTGAMPVIPGGEYQIASATRATNYTVQATSIGSAEEAFSDVSFVADGGIYVVEVGFPAWITGTANYNLYCYLCDGDGNAIATIGQLATSSGVGRIGPNAFRYYYTPSAGTRTVNIRFTKESGSANGTVEVDASSGRSVAGSFYLRVSKIVNQNDGLKPFWTPPVVTQLPSQATVGDQVVNRSSNGDYQPYFYTGATDGWKQVGNSKPPSCILTCSFTSLTLNGALGGGTYGTWSEDTDTDGMYSSGTAITVQTSGVYLITLNIWGNTSVQAQAVINAPSKVAHQTSANASPAWFGVSASSIVAMTAGQTINGDGYLSGTSTGTARLAATWMGYKT